MRSKDMTEEIARAPHRSLFKAVGMTDEELRRPMIGIAYVANDLCPGHTHMPEFIKCIRDGINIAGGTPVAFSTIGVCDGVAMNHRGMKFSLPSRELIADSIEIMASAHPFDGLVLVPNCDKSIPGMIMGALRLNIPIAVICGGPMAKGLIGDRPIDLGTVFEELGAYITNKISLEELQEVENLACPGVGCCSGMYTANSHDCIVEVLGLGLPYSGSAPANSGERLRLAKQTGMEIVRLVKENILPKDIVDYASIQNAITVDVALGCSTNSLLHLPAIAHAFGYSVTFDDFNRISDKTPQIASFRPGGSHHIQDLHLAGGIPAVLSELKKAGLINTASKNINGKSIEEITSSATKRLGNEVINDISEPYRTSGGLAVLRGNLAPNGAVIKKGALDKDMWKFKGSARVFNCEEDAYEAIMTGKINKGEVIVIRYEGPKGGPGMREMLAPTQALVGTGLSKDVFIITDGRFSGASSGPAIGYISPEAMVGGPIAVVRDGDIINIDIDDKMIGIELSDAEIADRLSRWEPLSKKESSAVLARYANNVTSSDNGAIFAED
ncbi:MAG TPA: dihydroxy-acid dehydratase [Ruminiclostridium sp.]|nr:dihydroxy-acid dehydratase [Ruminiclostridium sp.]